MSKILMALSLGMAAAFAVDPAVAGETETSPVAAASTASPNDSKTSDLARPNANHNLLGELAGTWNYLLKISMGPNKPPVETNGVVVRQPIMGGRYFLADFDVEMLPGADGKLEKANFKGKSIEGYDNVKEKFISIWIDNASTGPTIFEGSYDPASRTFTYTGETEPKPGQKTKVREVIKVIDSNHYNLEWYEEHGGHEIKTIEITYTRSPAPSHL
jgi:Protein of unknown function (DUF1579)